MDGSFDLIKAFTASVLEYSDIVNEDGKSYFYKVSSVDKDGLESDLNINPSMGTTLPKLSKPIITLAQIQGERAILNWQPGDRRAVSYVVHRNNFV